MTERQRVELEIGLKPEPLLPTVVVLDRQLTRDAGKHRRLRHAGVLPTKSRARTVDDLVDLLGELRDTRVRGRVQQQRKRQRLRLPILEREDTTFLEQRMRNDLVRPAGIVRVHVRVGREVKVARHVDRADRTTRVENQRRCHLATPARRERHDTTAGAHVTANQKCRLTLTDVLTDYKGCALPV